MIRLGFRKNSVYQSPLLDSWNAATKKISKTTDISEEDNMNPRTEITKVGQPYHSNSFTLKGKKNPSKNYPQTVGIYKNYPRKTKMYSHFTSKRRSLNFKAHSSSSNPVCQGTLLSTLALRPSFSSIKTWRWHFFFYVTIMRIK